jgi:hypothetical protein
LDPGVLRSHWLAQNAVADDGKNRLQRGQFEIHNTALPIGDETSLSLLGKAAFLETYAGSAEADNLRPLWKQSIQPGVTGPGSKATSPKSE